MEEEKQEATEQAQKDQDSQDVQVGQDVQDSQDSQGGQDSQESQESQVNQDSQASQNSQEGQEEQESQEKQPDWKDRYVRAMADFDNFRKRTARDREDLVKLAASDVLKDMLPTVDNLARALEEAKDKADDPFVAGVRLVYDGLVKALADHGATPLDSVGEPFDANFHEALAQLPSEEVEEGRVINEVKRGWMLHGKLLRVAQVVVSAGKKA
jgi:molecular chaperone GrpE